MYCQCKKCHEIFVIPTRRGRPPNFCSNCKPTIPKQRDVETLNAQEKVDRLEEKLKSRGLHISQHNEEENHESGSEGSVA